MISCGKPYAGNLPFTRWPALPRARAQACAQFPAMVHRPAIFQWKTFFFGSVNGIEIALAFISPSREIYPVTRVSEHRARTTSDEPVDRMLGHGVLYGGISYGLIKV